MSDAGASAAPPGGERVEAAPGPAIQSRVLRGLGWKAGSQIILQASRVAVALVLARLLTPDQYGMAAMVLVFGTFVIPFADLGFGAALVQRRSISELDRSTVFWTSLAAGGAFTVALVALSGPIASFYGEPRVRPMLVLLSASFIVTALGATHRSLLVRELDFRTLELRLVGGTVVGGVVALTLAARGFGPWAIVAQEVTIACVSTVLLWVLSDWRPRFAFSRQSLRHLGGFGANYLGSRVAWDLQQTIDNLLIGRFLGAAALGAYALAFNIVLIPFSRMIAPVQEVVFPAFSRLQDEERRLATAWLRSLRVVVAAALPALIGLVIVAPEFVSTVLGNKWHRATPVVQILALVGISLAIQGLNPIVLSARGRAGYTFFFSAASLLVVVVAIASSIWWGIVAVSVAYAIVMVIMTPIYTGAAARSVGVSAFEVVRALSGIGQAAVLMGVTVLFARWLLIGLVRIDAIRFAALVTIGVVSFIGACFWRAPDLVSEIRALRPAQPSTVSSSAPE